jgi:hypothetical protein
MYHSLHSQPHHPEYESVEAGVLSMTDKDQVTGGHEVEQQVDEASMAPTGHSDVQIEQAMSWDCAGSRAVINGGVSSPDFGNDADEGKGARGQIPSVYDLMAAPQLPSASVS